MRRTWKRCSWTVLERPDELLLDRFWLISSLDAETVPAAKLLELYRQRGRAETYMGELMDVLEPALSSAPRTKRHYRGRRLCAQNEGASVALEYLKPRSNLAVGFL